MKDERCELVRYLQGLNEPDRREVVALSLAATACVLRVDLVLLWLYDGSVLRLMGETRQVEATIPSVVEPGQGIVGCCFNEGQAVLFGRPPNDPWVTAAVMCDPKEPVNGCLVPVRLAGHSLGVLAAFRAGARRFEPVDLAAVEVQAAKLMLSLHHCAISPEICPDWMTVFEEQTGPSGGMHRLDNCPTLLSAQLPKGIHGPTLKATCRWVHHLGTQVTCKEAANALQLSQVTVGRYFSYMVSLGLVRRAVEYRQMGRPTYLYCAEQRCPQLPL